MMEPLGTRSPREAEHDLPPTWVLVGKIAPGRAELLADDGGAVPRFLFPEHARLCADELARVAVCGEPLFASLAPVACWQDFITDHLLAGRDPAELTAEEPEALRSYIFEAQAVNPPDARRQAVELAERILRGIRRRVERPVEG